MPEIPQAFASWRSGARSEVATPWDGRTPVHWLDARDPLSANSFPSCGRQGQGNYLCRQSVLTARRELRFPQFAQKRDQALAGAVAHETDLDGVLFPQIGALITDQKAGGLQSVTHRVRTNLLREHQCKNRRRRVSV